jgi:outer membrane protein TolC
MDGIVGQFFKSFALTVAFAVAMSLIIAFTLDPMLSSRFVRYVPPEERLRTRMGRLLERWGRAYERLDRQYHRVLRWALAHPIKVVAAATVVFVASLSTLSLIGTEFVPNEDRGEFVVMVDLPPGLSFDETVKSVSQVEKALLDTPEIRQVFTTVGVAGQTRKSQLRVHTTRKDERTVKLEAIKADLRVRLKAIPFAEIKVADPEFMQGAPYEPPINVYVRGNDMKELKRLSDELVTRISAVAGAVDVGTSLISGQPELVAQVDRARAADLGFSVGSVAMQVRSMVEGVVPSKLRQEDHEFDIRVRLAPEYRNDFTALAAAPIYSPTGAVIRTSELVRMEPGVGPSSIDREQRVRQAKIGIDLQGRALGDVTADIQKVLDEVSIPSTFQLGFAGDVELMQESAQGLMLALLLAVTFIYIVLASQFESFTEPVIIMLALPLALVGALLMLLATGQHLGMPAMIGIVMLMGLVTKNAILLVDLTNQLRREKGLSVTEAILQAGPVRLRPILMTTMAMVLGMLPSAFGIGEGGEFRAPMSLATIGGLLTSTLLTLVVVPVAYLLLDRVLERVRGWRKAPSPAMATAARITAMLALIALLGGVWFVTRAFAQTPQGRPLTFEEALQRASDNNEALKAAAARVRESESRVSEARTSFLPSADASYLYTPAQQAAALRIPAGIFGPDEQSLRANFVRENVLRFDVTQPIYAGGRLTHSLGVSLAQATSANHQLERARQALTLEVVQAYYGALLQQQGIVVAEEGLRRAEQQLKIAQTRFEAGSAARLDVLRAEVEVANARALLIKARSSSATAMQALRAVMSADDPAPFTLVGSLDEETKVPDSAELQARLPQRADVMALAAQRESAARSKKLATADLKPVVAFTGSLQYQQDGLNQFWNGDNQSFQAALAIKMPLFSAPRVAAQKAAATAREQQAEHAINATLDVARLELTSAYEELASAREIVEVQRKAVELAREGLSIAEVSYANGAITATELNDARVSLLQTEWALAQAKYGVIVAGAKTRFAAGL